MRPGPPLASLTTVLAVAVRGRVGRFRPSRGTRPPYDDRFPLPAGDGRVPEPRPAPAQEWLPY